MLSMEKRWHGLFDTRYPVEYRRKRNSNHHDKSNLSPSEVNNPLLPMLQISEDTEVDGTEDSFIMFNSSWNSAG